MSVMVTEVYDALIEAGASKESSKKAAEAVSMQDSRLTRIEFLVIGLYLAGVSRCCHFRL
jgi:hypothetical protein